MTAESMVGAVSDARDVATLHSILREQEFIYRRLIDLVRSEERVIIANDLPALDLIVAQKDKLAGDLDGLERRRVVWLDTFARERGLPADCSLLDVVDELGDSAAHALLEARARMTDLVFELAEQNRRNGLLITSVLRVLRRTVERVNALRDDRPAYSPTGQRYDAPQRASLNLRA